MVVHDLFKVALCGNEFFKKPDLEKHSSDTTANVKIDFVEYALFVFFPFFSSSFCTKRRNPPEVNSKVKLAVLQFSHEGELRWTEVQCRPKYNKLTFSQTYTETAQYEKINSGRNHTHHQLPHYHL